MKKTIFLVLAAAACIGLLLTACPNEPEKKPEYTVTFNAKGASAPSDAALAAGQSATKKVEKGKAIGALPTLAANATHNFSKWTSGTAADSAEVTAATPVNGNMTVYAQWTAKGSGGGDVAVSNVALAGFISIAPPVRDVAAVNVTTTTSTQYDISGFKWTNPSGGTHTGAFAASTVYKAEFTLTPKTGFTFTGVNLATAFSFTGATTVAAVAAGAAATVTVTFPATAAAGQDTIINHLALNTYINITAPVKDATAANGTATAAATQYDMSGFKWINPAGGTHTGAFAASTIYKAEFTLTPKAGYTFTGVTLASAFSYTNATVAAVAAGANATVTITFTATEADGGGSDLTSFSVTVGETVQNDITLTASGAATFTYIDDGYRVVTTGNYGPFVYFTVDLGTGKSITDFEKVTFDYKAVEGDIGWKDIFLLAGNDDDTLVSGTSSPWMVSGVRWGQGAGTLSLVGTIGDNQGAAMSAALPTAEGEINFAIYLHAAAQAGDPAAGPYTTYEITNIVFVPLSDEHHPVEGITGVPAVGEVGAEVDLTKAVATPASATNKVISWAVTTSTAAGVTVGPLPSGKLNPTGAGAVTVTATITDGTAVGTNYTAPFEITIRSVPTVKPAIILTDMTLVGSATATLDGDGLGFTLTGGANYQYNAPAFIINLGSATLKDVVKVTFDYVPLAGDTSYKGIFFAATTSDGSFSGNMKTTAGLGSVQTGNAPPQAGPDFTPISLEIVLDYTLAKAISGNSVKIAIVAEAAAQGGGVDTSYRIENIQFYVAD
jgi:hypothetical protein